MEYLKFRSKIRHFLLKNCEIYYEAIRKEKETPPVSSMARQLNKKCPIGERRLQKFLYVNTTDKELSITISDLVAFAKLDGSSLDEFVAYLVGESYHQSSLSDMQKSVLEFMAKLNLGLRRELSLKVFDPNSLDNGEKIISLAIELASLSPEDLDFCSRIVKNLRNTYH